MENKVFVPDMSCEHCVARIEKSLKEHNVEAQVDLDSKTVAYQNDEQLVRKAIEEAGYNVEAR